MSKEYRAITLSEFLTAREMPGQILLFTPSDATGAGHISPANEIYLSRDMIKKLAEWAEDSDD